ncbi:lipase 3-like isoform X2 [Haematobia irritans]|uniref:lipase 3-like isoform X2 n=1 Tax=Haematobia irritans TaxID=7368 RepID=UPI003F4FF51D
MDRIKRSAIVKSLLIIPILIIVVQLQYSPEENTKTTTDRVQRAGYKCANYDFYTQDGYGLRIFRIKNTSSSLEESSETSSITKRPVVLLMHGIASSSDSWVLEDLSNPLAYDLLNNGYDVWLGNNRGNTYGQKHLHMSSYDREFWRFSFHEGTTIALVLLSMNTEYNRKFKSITMFSPCANLTFTTSPLRHISLLLGNRSPLHSIFEDLALLRPKIVRQLLGIERCRRVGATSKYCSFLLFNALGGYSAYINKSLLPEIFYTHPEPSSFRQTIHFMQIHNSQMFRQYDFGPKENLLIYNQSTPTEYNLANVNPRWPIHLFYSDYDEIASKKDVEMLAEILGNRSVTHFINLKHFAHMDFIWASNIKEIINRPVLDIIGNVGKKLENNVN